MAADPPPAVGAEWASHAFRPGPALVAVSAGDLARDGHVDLVLGDAGLGVSALLGQGAGRFGLLLPLPPWQGVSDVRVVDLDGDGLLDVAATTRDPQETLATFAGAADGGFGAAVGVPGLAGGAVAVTVADLDGDGVPELVVAVVGQGLVALDRGWEGIWDPYTTVAEGDPVAVAAADLDGDGDRDIVGAWSDRPPTWTEGLGDGAFGRTRALGDVVLDTDLELADLDGDGDVDVLGVASSLDRVDVLENRGGGVFAPSVTLGAFVVPAAVAHGDLDGDAVPDLVVADPRGLLWMRGLGGLRFADESRFGLAIGVDLAVVDLDADGDRDVAVVGPLGTAWFENALAADADRDGLADASEVALGTDPARADTDGGGRPDDEELAWGTSPTDPLDDLGVDLDGDLATDAEEVAAGTDPGAFDTDRDGAADGAELAAGADPLTPDSDGDGWVDGQELHCGSDPVDDASFDRDCDRLTDAEEATLGTDPDVADTDRDGLLDGDEGGHGADPLVADTDGGGAVDGEEVRVGHDPGDPTDDWRRRVVDSSGDATAVAAVDLDVDGDLDAVVAFAAPPRVVWFENLGGGVYGSLRTLADPAGTAPILVPAQIDADGRMDLVTADDRAGVRWFLAGDPVLGSRDLGVVVPSRWALAAVDEDGDGDSDLVAANSAAVEWVLNVGDGVFVETPYERFGPTTRTIAAADVQGDGTPDVLVLTEGDAPQVLLFASAEPFTLGSAVVAVASPTARGMRPCDVDADGAPDVVLARGGTTPDLGWNRNLAGTLDGVTTTLAGLDAQPTALGVGNLDGDADEDLVVGTAAGTTVFVLSGGALTPWFVAEEAPVALVLADLDGDGAPDLLAATDEGVVWYHNGLPEGSDLPPEVADTGGPPSEDTGPAPVDPPTRAPLEGCGCGSGGPSGAGGMLGLLLAAALLVRCVRGEV